MVLGTSVIESQMKASLSLGKPSTKAMRSLTEDLPPMARRRLRGLKSFFLSLLVDDDEVIEAERLESLDLLVRCV
jgi:hypothetical protein